MQNQEQIKTSALCNLNINNSILKDVLPAFILTTNQIYYITLFGSGFVAQTNEPKPSFVRFIIEKKRLYVAEYKNISLNTCDYISEKLKKCLLMYNKDVPCDSCVFYPLKKLQSFCEESYEKKEGF